MGSIYFQNCFGVFQGGGARAVALAGAYRAAHLEGVRFSGVAGTSAGSIAAVLIGAGANPQFVEDALTKLDFMMLLKPPEPGGAFSARWPALLGRALVPLGLLSENVKAATQVLRYGGLYSSRGIEEWIEERLRELLPGASSPVRFKDLRIPTYVVATNLTTRLPQIWSTESNSEESVSLAVRASASIPVFFQPVVMGSMRLVDGGMLSNLPVTVFGEESRRELRRILAFRLTGESPPRMEWTPGEMTSQLIDTVVNGATALQVDVVKVVSCIDIPTSDIVATDFYRLDSGTVASLIDKGHEATKKFFSREALHLRATKNNADVFLDRDAMFLAIARQTHSLPSEVLIAERDTDWYWRIFPTILFWRVRGVSIRVLLQRASGDAFNLAKERSRRANLAGIGVHVEEIEVLPLQGYVFSRTGSDASSAIVFLPYRLATPVAAMYEGESNQFIIELIQRQLADAFTKWTPGRTFTPSIARSDDSKLCSAIKTGVTQYAPVGVSVSIETIPIKGVRTITKLVKAYKLEQMQHLIELFNEANIPLFASAEVILDGDKRSLMGPPVFELHGDVLIGVEGNTRTYWAHLFQRDAIQAVIVRGVTAQPPGSSVDVSDCSLIEYSEKPEITMPGFQYGLFRRIEGACHPHR